MQPLLLLFFFFFSELLPEEPDSGGSGEEEEEEGEKQGARESVSASDSETARRTSCPRATSSEVRAVRTKRCESAPGRGTARICFFLFVFLVVVVVLDKKKKKGKNAWLANFRLCVPEKRSLKAPSILFPCECSLVDQYRAYKMGGKSKLTLAAEAPLAPISSKAVAVVAVNNSSSCNGDLYGIVAFFPTK